MIYAFHVVARHYLCTRRSMGSDEYWRLLYENIFCFGVINIFKELTNKSFMFVSELKKALLKH